MTSPIDWLVTELRKDWIEWIKNLIARKEQEQFFIDFKNFSIRDYSWKKTLEDSDRKNFSKAISWFWNSEGWVLIWWISGKDHAEMLDPINWYETFLNLVNSFVSRSTIPAHMSVENFSIPSDGETGFVVTIIPKSDNTPHRTIDWQKEWQYYMRAWDSFLPVPHSVLAGMFGRRPNSKLSFNFMITTPKIDATNTLVIEKWIMLRNDWAWLARHVYCHCMINSIPQCMNETEIFRFSWSHDEFRASMALWRQMQCYSIWDFLLAPWQFSQPIIINLRLHPPFNEDLKIKVWYWCEWQEKWLYELYYSKERLFEIYTKALSWISAEDLSKIMKDDAL